MVRLNNQSGYSLVELMLVVVILAIVASIISPRYDLVLVKAWQSRTKNNLGVIRTGLGIYYSSQEGNCPFHGSPVGAPASPLYDVLVPGVISNIFVPQTKDRTILTNGTPYNYDQMAEYHLSQNPKEDIFISHSFLATPDWTRPWAYIPSGVGQGQECIIFMNNDNLDRSGISFFEW